ncbi:MAG TPA: thioredoxin family protein [Prolixibacteraceae bacterium]|jgi:thiol-disulfide isomerase/thioredoxin
MKKLLLIIPALLFSVLGFSQGIEFEHGTWKEILAKAQQTNKPIFVDVFTTWCGPCKMMDRDIFPLETVGKVYNAGFVCYHLDAEKGDGIEVAKKYEVKAYPTYLFIKADGTLFFRSLGSMEAKAFLEVSNTALSEFKDPKSLPVWEKEYTDKKNDPKFLLHYMDKRSKLKLSNAGLFDEYLKLIPEEEHTSDIVVKLYTETVESLKVNSFAYANLKKNKDILAGKLSGLFLLYLGIENTVSEAAKSKNEQLFTEALLAYDQLPKGVSPLRSKDELYMLYFQRTGESDKYVKYASNFGNNSLMKITDDSIASKDKVSAQLLEKKISAGEFAKLDSTQIAQIRAYNAHAERNLISLSLNEIAWTVFLNVSDKKALQEALNWSKRSRELSPDNSGYLDTYANLLYKLGRKEEAITCEKEALGYDAKANKEPNSIMVDALRKMIAGEKTWTN